MNYLKKQNTKATASEMKEYVNKLREDPDGQKLTRAEIMQFINLRPTQVVIFIENFRRMSNRIESGT